MDDQEREARVGRVVTWSFLAVLAVVAVGGLELVAEHLDGTEEPLLVSETNPVLVTTDRQFPDLRREPEEVQREMVLAWLDVSGVDPATVGSVRLDRIARHYDVDTHTWADVGRTTIVDVDL